MTRPPEGSGSKRRPISTMDCKYTAVDTMEKVSSTTALTPQKTGITGRLILAIISSAMGMFNFGYNTGVINAPQMVIKGFFNETTVARTGSPASDSTLNLLWSFTVAITAAGGMFGGVLGAWWADKFGRRGGMLVNTGIGIVAAALMGFSKLATSYEMLIIGRLIVGFNCGLYTGLSPIYNSEVAPDKIRGALGTLNQLAVTVGMLISQVLGLDEILGTPTLWPLLLGLTAAPPLVQILTLPLVPESPSYLFLTKDEKEKATHSLMILRGAESPDEVAEEIENMEKEKESESSEKMGLLQVLRSPYLRRPLVLTVLLHLSQQFSGINCIFYYSTDLFTKVGLEPSTAKYATLGVGGIMVVMTLVSIPLMDRSGRKTLHLTGLCGMFLFSIAFTICFVISDRDGIAWLRILTITLALLIVVFFAVGPGSIPWMLVPELFAQGPRSVAVNIGVVTNWLSNFIVGQVFTPLQGALKQLVFIPFTVLLAFFIVSLYFLMPETKGKTIDEITALFDKRQSGTKDDKEDTRTTGYYKSCESTTF